MVGEGRSIGGEEDAFTGADVEPDIDDVTWDPSA
jgi:hypothetical protein